MPAQYINLDPSNSDSTHRRAVATVAKFHIGEDGSLGITVQASKCSVHDADGNKLLDIDGQHVPIVTIPADFSFPLDQPVTEITTGLITAAVYQILNSAIAAQAAQQEQAQ